MNRRFAAASVLLATFALSSVAGADETPTPRITVEIGALRSAKGVVRCSLYASANGFPTDPSKAAALVIAPSIANGDAVCIVDNVKPGTYAVGFLHDENNNGKMDTNFLGMPTEGYGASNNARGTMGPPSFNAAKFTHESQTTLHLKTEY